MLITDKDLPNTAMGTGFINLEINSIETEGYDLFPDGSIGKTVKVNADISEIIKVTEADFGTSIQIYRIQGEERETYITVNKKINYDFLNIKWNSMFTNRIKYHEILHEKTDQAEQDINKILMNFDHSRHLMRKEFLRQIRDIKSVKVNMAIILTGEKRVSTIKSINNLAMLKSNDFVENPDFITVLTLIRPSEIRNKEIFKESVKTSEMIIAVNGGENRETRRVHTMNEEGLSRIVKSAKNHWYINCSFLIHDKSVNALNRKCIEMEKVFSEKGILLYQHVNSIRNQYKSLFPGYSEYGEHFNMAYREFVNRTIFTYMTY